MRVKIREDKTVLPKKAEEPIKNMRIIAINAGNAPPHKRQVLAVGEFFAYGNRRTRKNAASALAGR